MTPRNGHSTFEKNLAFKSVEIEELTDVYFFRPLGSLIARGARATGITPSGLTITGGLIGMAAGALLYDECLGVVAFAFLVLHSIFDSADGQLARMTGQVTDLGRVLDAAGGYVTHVAIFVAIGANLLHRGWSTSIVVWMLLAGIATAIHAQMYVYHRDSYIAVVTKGQAVEAPVPTNVPLQIGWLVRAYFGIQRWFVGLHGKVEATLADRAGARRIREDDRILYREVFYPLVRGWNFLGDNTRFFAVGVLVCLHRIDLFFAFVLVAMNLAFVLLWLWQRRADRRFLASLGSVKLSAE
ncbi:MAG: CDP-alcohol phosphatidyltransferase family protein [Chthoniobacterales bacterium]